MKWINKVYKKTISIIWSYIRRTLFRCYGINASKGNSLTWLSKEYNLDLNKTICFGDAENDETMFNVAKFSGLTSNCFESVKNKAIFNLGDNDTNWLNDFIKKYNKKDQI
ncbi:HAD hydrolase family protein [Mycoplasmopsis felis]|uniref:HAD hydrolase family protein n=1 Tax=Mycoplasmopsis felis TaxID=33923 RepID=UPI003A5C7E94